MKRFACGDVVPGCTASWTSETEDEMLAQVAEHARAEHNLTELDDDLVADVRSHIVTTG